MHKLKETIYFPRLIQFKQEISPIWLGAVHNKILSDGLELSPGILLLLCQGFDFCYKPMRDYSSNRKFSISGVSQTLWQNLSFSLGLYLDSFCTIDIKDLQIEIKNILKQRVCPPMIELPLKILEDQLELEYGTSSIMMMIAGLSQDEQELVVIHPTEKKYIHIPYSCLEKNKTLVNNNGWKLIMLKSPSFAKPKFRPLKECLKCGILTWTHKFRYLQELDSRIMLTGRQAFDACINDLKMLSDHSHNYDWTFIVESILNSIHCEFGASWGRDFQNIALKEAYQYLGIEGEGNTNNKLAILWCQFSSSINDALTNGTDCLKKSAEILELIRNLELQNAGAIENLVWGACK